MSRSSRSVRCSVSPPVSRLRCNPFHPPLADSLTRLRRGTLTALAELAADPCQLRELRSGLTSAGHADLHGLLDERALAGLLDALIEQAGSGDAAGLRASDAGRRAAEMALLQRLLGRLQPLATPDRPRLTRLTRHLEAFDVLVSAQAGVPSVAMAPAPGAATRVAPPPPATTAPAGENVRFILLRVAPFTGFNPFDARSVRDGVTAAKTPSGGTVNACVLGPLTLTTPLNVISFGAIHIDVSPAAGSLILRSSGGTLPDTALTMTLPALDQTRFAVGSPGWQAVSPALPQQYPAGAPAQTFRLRRLDSGDHYRLTIGFLGTSQIIVTSASGECCGPGGCP